MMKKRRKVPRVAVREEGYTEFAYEDAKPFTPQQADKIEKIVVDVIHRMSSR